MKALFGKNNINPNRISNLLFIGLALIIFVVLVIRAIQIPLFIDEIYTYDHYVRTGYFGPVSPYSQANNHLVNTILTYFSFEAFGNSSLALRLPNILAFVLFCVYLFRIGNLLKTRIAKWSLYIGLLLSLNFIVFFAVGRGYGLSFAFGLASFYYVYKLFDNNSVSRVFLALLFLGLALFSNFSLLLFYLILGGVILLLSVKQREFYYSVSSWWKMGLAMILYLLVFVVAIDILFYYKDAGLLWWGSLYGFRATTLNSLLFLLFQFTTENVLVWGLLLAYISIIGLVFVLNKFRIEKKQFATWILFLNVIGIIVLANIFEVNYPYQRTGLHLYLFFILSVSFVIDSISIKWIRVVIVLPLLLIPIHFILSFNVSEVVFWSEDNLPKDYFEKVKSIEDESKSEYVSSIFIEGTTYSSWDYYLWNDFSPSIPRTVMVRETKKDYYDYLIDREENVTELMSLFDTLAINESGPLVLYKRKKSTKRKLIFDITDSSYYEKSTEFHELVRMTLDTFYSSSLFIESIIQLDYQSYPFVSAVVIVAEDNETKEKYAYRTIELDTKQQWIPEEPFVHGGYLHEIPKGRKVDILVYIWAREKQPYIVHSSKVKIHQVIE